MPDPLVDVLEVLRVRGSVAATVAAAEPWGLQLEDMDRAALHAVTAGTCWLLRVGEPPLHLMPGDVVLIPTGARHALASEPDAPLVGWDHIASAAARGSPVHVGVGSVQTRILCASYQHSADAHAPLLGLLPPILHLQAGNGAESSEAVLRLVAAELGAEQLGVATVLDRLVDILFIHVVRAWLRGASPTDSPPSWLTALRDPVSSAALTALHAAPARAWTLDTLAAAAGVSRATLVRRFAGTVGQPPLAYLTGWRLELAAQQLRETNHPVQTIAHTVGYTSQFAFSRAFSRQQGLSPGRYRTHHRSPESR